MQITLVEILKLLGVTNEVDSEFSELACTFSSACDENKGFALDGFDSTTSLKSDDFDEKATTAAMKLVDSFSSPTGETFAKVRNDYGKVVYVTVSCAFKNGNETVNSPPLTP